MEKFFHLAAAKTSVRQELIAGLTTFLAMIYIVPVNANIMSIAGMPFDALVTATALITIIATLFNGLFANTPVALSVGMGLNAYFTFALCVDAKMPWQSALGIVAISGALFTVLSFTNFRVWVIKSIPLDLRRAISAGIGAFICFIGLKQMGVIAPSQATLVTLGNLKDLNVLLGILGLAVVLVLFVLRIKAAFILSILITSCVAWVAGISPAPHGIVSAPSGITPIFAKLDIPGALKLAFVPFIITFFVTHLFDSIGTLTGVGNRAGLFGENSKDGMKKLSRNLTSDAIGSGVEAGGRTGLTAVFCAIFFVLTLFMLPLFKAIPANAIYPILVMVGVLMFSELGKIDYSDAGILIPAFFIVFLMPFTYSITNGLSFGFIAYIVVRLAQRKIKDLNFGVLTLGAISVLVFLMH